MNIDKLIPKMNSQTGVGRFGSLMNIDKLIQMLSFVYIVFSFGSPMNIDKLIQGQHSFRLGRVLAL